MCSKTQIRYRKLVKLIKIKKRLIFRFILNLSILEDKYCGKTPSSCSKAKHPVRIREKFRQFFKGGNFKAGRNFKGAYFTILGRGVYFGDPEVSSFFSLVWDMGNLNSVTVFSKNELF